MLKFSNLYGQSGGHDMVNNWTRIEFGILLVVVINYMHSFVLQYYDLCKTDELPNLEGSSFSPKVKILFSNNNNNNNNNGC